MNRLRSAVRPIVTMLFAGALVAGFFLGRLTADQFMPVGSAVVLFWFTTRAADKRESD